MVVHIDMDATFDKAEALAPAYYGLSNDEVAAKLEDGLVELMALFFVAAARIKASGGPGVADQASDHVQAGSFGFLVAIDAVRRSRAGPEIHPPSDTTGGSP